MSWKPVNALLVALGLSLAALGGAAAQEAAAAPKDAAARRAQLLERYKRLDPKQRKQLLEVYRERIKSLDGEDKTRLRKLARGKGRHREGRGKLRHGKGEGDAKHAFMQRFVKRLSEEDRQRLANLEPDARREALKQLLGAHRKRNLHRDLELIPGDRRRELEGELEGLDPKERFRRVRSVLGDHFRVRMRELMTSDASLEEKRAQLAELLEELPPPLRKRFEEQFERRLGGAEGRPARPGGGPVPRGPRGTRRQGRDRGQRR